MKIVNAASKGDVAMTLYFLNHANAKPFLKNNFSEAAYDVAAANSEAYLCEILQSSEKQWWKGTCYVSLWANYWNEKLGGLTTLGYVFVYNSGESKRSAV